MRLTQALYEDKVLSSVPESVIRSLVVKCEAGWEEKESLIYSIGVVRKVVADLQSETDIENYSERIRKYVTVETLGQEMLLNLPITSKSGNRIG